jgi:hypothetical protein
VHTGGGKPGDFGWMLCQTEYDGALFIFNDNEQQFRDFQKNPRSGSGCSPGGGNAAIRPYRCQDPPRAAGVPTGSHGVGYERLTDHVRGVVDEAIGVVRDLVATGRYDRLIYSASGPDGGLGSGIFDIGDDVKGYIVDELRKLAGG